MDIEQKKSEVKADIARGPENVVFARIDICDEVQLADLMKEQFTPYFRQTARVASSGTTGNADDSLHEVCVNLAKQRALLQGAAVGDVMNFAIGTEAQYATSGALSLPDFTDSSYSNKTSFGFIVLHQVNESGGSVTLSSTSNANTSITDDDGNAIKYFTDFSKYFLTRSRANGELISIDDNTTPYMLPTVSEPFVPPPTINGVIYRGVAPDPTANSDVRYEFGTAANTSGGNAGGDLDIVENKWTGNTFVTITVTDVVGTFATSETISDYDLNTATIKTYANTTSVFLEGQNSKGTFVADELISDLSTNATISTVASISDEEKNLTLTGSSFITGSNTDITLGFDTSTTIALDIDSVSRSGGTVSVIANNHGINPGERIVLKGADDAYSEFNDTFIIEDTTSNTLTFTTSNAISTIPTGDFSLVNNIVFGRTSNASMSIFKRTANSSATIVFQSDDLSVGFPIANTITGSSLGATGSINGRTEGGTWYQTKTNEVKTFFSNSTVGTWDYDATNNPVGIPATANAGVFWLQEFQPVKIDQIVARTNAGASNETSSKMVLDIAIATAADKTGGFDTSIDTKLPGIYFSYPLKSYADQVHDGVTTLNAYESFANVVIAPEGLEINFDWLPLSNLNGNLTGTDIAVNGTVANTSHIPDKVTTLSKANFNAHLGPYNGAATSPIDDVFRSTNPDRRSSGVKVGVVYPSINTNPFFPAISANSTFLATGYSAPAGANTANDIFSGSYTHVETGAIEPGTAGGNTHDYRYVIQNDLKWTYATNPFATGSTGAGQVYNAPRGAPGFHPTYDGYTELGRDASWTAISNETAAGPGASTGSEVTSIGPDTTGATCTTASHVAAGNNNKTHSVGSHPAVGLTYANTLRVLTATCAATAGCSTSTHNNQSACDLGHDQSGNYWVTTYGLTSTATTEVPCLYNRVHQFLTAAGGAVTIGSATNMEANIGILYTLLLNLIASSTYNKDYEDPLCNAAGEHPAGSYSAGDGKSDSSFEQETEDMKKAIDDLIVAHADKVSDLGSHNFANSGGSAYSDSTGTNGKTYLQCLTGSTAGTDGVKSVNAELATYKVAIKNRIGEITNRIGVVNGKDAGVGGTNGPTPGSLGSGFVGFTFPTGTSGKGYANTVYSHANFLAGKKINLLGKVLKAIVAVQAMYDSVTTKRAEYYEYNQAD